MDLPKGKKMTEHVAGPDLETQWNGTASDLIPGIQNEITLGPIMDRLPRDVRLPLMTLNRAWREVLLNVHANFIVVYTYSRTWVLSPVNSTLRIFQDGILRSLPLPGIPSIDMKYSRFLVTDQQIYSVISTTQNMYNIKVHDLEGGMIGWQSLPLLPNRGRFVYITSNYADGDNKNSRQTYIWMCDVEVDSSCAEFNFSNDWERVCSTEESKWSVWGLQTDNSKGNSTLEWQQQRVLPQAPLQVLKNIGNKPPQYLDICRGDYRYLYKRHTLSACSFKELDQLSTEVRDHSDTPIPFLLVFKDDYDGCEGGAIAGINFILPRRSVDGRTFKVNVYRKQLQSVEAIYGDELNSFQSFWSNYYSFPRVASDEQMSAVKFVADIYWSWNTSEQKNLLFSLPSGEGDELILNKCSTISLAQGQTMYGYSWVASKGCSQ